MRPKEHRSRLEFKPMEAKTRSHQPDYLTGSVTGKGSRMIQQGDFVLSSVDIDSGELAVHEVVVTSNNKDAIIASIDWGVFIGSVTLTGALVPWLPGITALDLADYQVIGPFKSVLSVFDSNNFAEFGGDSTPIGRDSERMIVHNIAAGPVTVWFYNQVKYIMNNSSGGGRGSSSS